MNSKLRSLALLALGVLPVSAAYAQPEAICTASPERLDAPPVIFDDFTYADARTPQEDAGTASLFGTTWWRASATDSVRSKAWYRGNRHDLTVDFIEMEDGSVHLGLPAAPPKRERSPGFSSSFLTREGIYVTRVWMDRFEDDGVIQAFWLYSIGGLRFPRPRGGAIDYATELDFEFTPDFSRDRKPRLHVSNKIRKAESFDQVDGELNCIDATGTTFPDCLDRDGRSVFGGRWAYVAIRVTDAEVAYAFLAPETDDGRSALWGGGPDARSNAGLFSSLQRPTEAVWGQFLSLSDTAYLPSRDVASIFSLLYMHPDERPLDKPYRMLADWYLFSPCTSLSIDDAADLVEEFRTRQVARMNTTDYATEVVEPPAEEPHTARIQGPAHVAYGENGTWTIRPPLRGTTYVTTYRYRWLSTTESSPWVPVYTPDITLRASSGYTGLEIEASLLDYWSPHGAAAPNNHRATTRRRVSFTQ